MFLTLHELIFWVPFYNQSANKVLGVFLRMSPEPNLNFNIHLSLIPLANLLIAVNFVRDKNKLFILRFFILIHILMQYMKEW